MIKATKTFEIPGADGDSFYEYLLKATATGNQGKMQPINKHQPTSRMKWENGILLMAQVYDMIFGIIMYYISIYIHLYHLSTNYITDHDKLYDLNGGYHFQKSLLKSLGLASGWCS